jgi:hypothetical protein
MGNIARFCSNCNEKTLQDAEIYGTDQRNRVIGGASSVIHQDLLEQR